MKKIPKFKSLSEESAFWLENDSTDYIDWNAAKSASFPELGESKPISIPKNQSNQ